MCGCTRIQIDNPLRDRKVDAAGQDNTGNLQESPVGASASQTTCDTEDHTCIKVDRHIHRNRKIRAGIDQIDSPIAVQIKSG